MAAILDFQSERFKVILIHTSPWYVTLLLLTKIQVNWPLRFKRRNSTWRLWRPSWIFDRKKFSFFFFFVLQSVPTRPTNFDLFVHDKRLQLCWMSNQNEFSNYWSASHPDTFYLVSLPSLKSVGLSFQVFNINGRNGDYLEFTIKKNLVILDMQVTLILPTKLGVNLPFSSGEETQTRFSR